MGAESNSERERDGSGSRFHGDRTRKDFYFYYVPGLGRDRIFPCHPLLPASNLQPT